MDVKLIDVINMLRVKEEDLKIYFKEIERSKSEGALNLPILLTKTRKTYEECKELYRRLGNDIENLQEIQADELTKYGQQEWGKYDELCHQVEILQAELLKTNKENNLLKMQNNDLQREVLALKKDQRLSSIRESTAAMNAVGRVLSSVGNMQNNIQLCEILGWSENLDIRELFMDT